MDIKSLTIGQRLRLFLDDLGIEQQELANTMKISKQVVSNAINGKTKYPKSDFLIQIIDSYPNLNIYWLLTGSGEMYVTESLFTEENHRLLEALKAENSKLKDKIIELLEKLNN